MTSTPIEFGVLAFSSLFAMVDPIASAPLFVDLTKRRADHRKKTAVRACLTALVALLLFATVGSAIFGFFGITVPAFQIVGGLLFTLSAMKELQGHQHEPGSETESDDPSVVPIGIPLIAGAGSISTVMVLAGQARSGMHQAALITAICLAISLTLVIFMFAPALVSKLGPAGQNVLSKIMALLTAVLGVQFIINGGTAVLAQLIEKVR
ncbi:MAG TPA: MarC family protein [Fimbriimonadaceae bacterium]|nr:MarC family protein [Fimbriimonadaceae bacterium]